MARKASAATPGQERSRHARRPQASGTTTDGDGLPRTDPNGGQNRVRALHEGALGQQIQPLLGETVSRPVWPDRPAQAEGRAMLWGDPVSASGSRQACLPTSAELPAPLPCPATDSPSVWNSKAFAAVQVRRSKGHFREPSRTASDDRGLPGLADNLAHKRGEPGRREVEARVEAHDSHQGLSPPVITTAAPSLPAGEALLDDRGAGGLKPAELSTSVGLRAHSRYSLASAHCSWPPPPGAGRGASHSLLRRPVPSVGCPRPTAWPVVVLRWCRPRCRPVCPRPARRPSTARTPDTVGSRRSHRARRHHSSRRGPATTTQGRSGRRRPGPPGSACHPLPLQAGVGAPAEAVGGVGEWATSPELGLMSGKARATATLRVAATPVSRVSETPSADRAPLHDQAGQFTGRLW